MECSINYATKRSHENVLRFGCCLLLRATFESLVSHIARYAPFSTFKISSLKNQHNLTYF